jgi:hypothetical protein
MDVLMIGRILFLLVFLGVNFAARTDEEFGFLYFWFCFWLGIPMLMWAAIYYAHAWWATRRRSISVMASPTVQALEHDPEILPPEDSVCFCRKLPAACFPAGPGASRCLLEKCPDCY